MKTMQQYGLYACIILVLFIVAESSASAQIEPTSASTDSIAPIPSFKEEPENGK